ncbi:ATP-binding cassette domain-containing protein [Tsukamurella paurometabola]|uniref:Glutamine transport ATP-binding protein GlnQ n=1 Tax=Tsukamurella paurometabola TaxID=2061 RepID=A0A3P8LGT6_TSUPA|nr:ATP-binding cassette domain-containing protein [Tsukamurella paurometabola]UEA83622.1 ATP-binding cassette domain-containing protein [Tsukamurella paurometabola]VDR40752.1 Glutamine transport ATP-binding protein GlnQ [Tsukamurella paurometabola]
MSTDTAVLTVTVDGQTLTFAPGKTVTFGRTLESDVTINHPLVSRTHAVASAGPTGWVLTDRSTNGVFTGGVRRPTIALNGTQQLMFGDPRSGAPVTFSAAPRSNTPPPPPQRTPPPATPQQPVQQIPAARRAPSNPVPRPHPAPAPGAGGPPAPPAGTPRATPAPPSRPMPLPPRQEAAPSAPVQSSGVPPRPTGDVAPHLRAMAGNTGLYQVAKMPSLPVGTGQMTIGRTPENDIAIGDMLVSRRHARLLTGPQGLVIEDLGSANGTQVNGRRIAGPTSLRDGDLVTVGNSDLIVEQGRLERPKAQEFAGAGLAVQGITLTVDGNKTLLHGVDFRAAPGTLTAVIGPSGAGKSTVSRVVSGAVTPTAGRVEFEGRDVHRDFDALRSRIGMVPQDDVLHRQLTLQQALRFAAELRLPPDMSKADRDQVIDGVLAELQLTEHKQTRVDKLSGGQRKRASVAMELLTGPSLLILDEPTSGLDPALDRQVMQTLRRLADAGRVVIVVTHSLTHIDMCDQVLLLAPGGKTAYCGSPKGVQAAMGTGDWAEIFDFTAKQPDVAWQRYRSANPAPPPPAPTGAPPNPAKAPKASVRKQLSVVARRQLRLILADRGYLVFLLLLPLVLGGITLLTPADDGLASPYSLPDGYSGAKMILVLLVVGACFMGAALTSRDLVGERAIYQRERAVGLGPGAYLAAKTLVYFVAATIQAIMMMAIVIVGVKQSTAQGSVLASAPVELIIDIAILACVSTLVGLLISALAKSSEQVMPMLVVVVMVQLVMSGGLFALHERVGLEQISWLFPSRWGFAASASTVELQKQVDAVSGRPTMQAIDPLWDSTPAQWGIAIGVLVGTAVVLWFATWFRISRSSR